MMKIIVSVISEQSVPNMVMIKNNQDADKFVNIVTKKSKAYLDNFKEALKKSIPDIDDKSVVIDVDETKSSDILKNLEYKGNIFDEAKEIFVNITGGTKILSIFTYQFFSMNYKDKSRFFYMDIGKSAASFIELPKDTDVPMEKYDISLEEYLRSYGVVIQKKGSLLYSRSIAQTILDKFICEKYENARSGLQKVRKYLKEKNVKSSKVINLKEYIEEQEKKEKEVSNLLDEVYGCIDDICSYIDDIHEAIPLLPDSHNITRKNIEYILSKFLEEYIYYLIRCEIFNDIDYEKYLQTDVDIKFVQKDNKHGRELDVIFIFNNRLVYVECKTSIGQDNSIFSEAIYKQAATNIQFGLHPYSLFVYLDNKKTQEMEDKEKTYGVKLITKEELLSNGENGFINKIKNAVKWKTTFQ